MPPREGLPPSRNQVCAPAFQLGNWGSLPQTWAASRKNGAASRASRKNGAASRAGGRPIFAGGAGGRPIFAGGRPCLREAAPIS